MGTLGTLGFFAAALARPRRGWRHMQRYRFEQLRRVIHYAASEVPFYREHFRVHGFSTDDLRSAADLVRIPLTGKEELRTLRRAFTAASIAERHLIEHKSSGSTGTPIAVLRAPREERRLNLLRWRMEIAQGLRPGDRIASLRTTWEPLSARFDRPQSVLRSTRLLDTRVFDCLLDPADNYREILEFQPTIFKGYPGALVRIVQEHQRRGGELKNLRRISSGGEAMTPARRRVLEDAFGVPVLSTYGTTESNLVAWQCPESGLYHVNDDGVFVEVCRDGNPVAEGERGEVIVTTLHAFTMPVIRYAMGDLAVAGPERCPCGAPFSTIHSIEGRTIDFLRTTSGREIHPFELLNEIVVADDDWIVEYQFAQESPDRFRLLVVPGRQVTEEEEERVRKAVLRKLDAGVELRIEMVETIPVSAGGKHHYCRSDIQAMP